ncbi:hypothetical protein ZWY2020_017137 [Hordeum vulgare]|nr:hypothetical protein ZWY2020_017137 [Hordeum vulgare]
MSTFAGVSVLDGDKPCSCVAAGVGAGAGANSVYHLVVVKGYSGIKKELPNGESWCTELFRVGAHEYSIEFYPNGANTSCADFISLDITRLTTKMSKRVWKPSSVSVLSTTSRSRRRRTFAQLVKPMTSADVILVGAATGS